MGWKLYLLSAFWSILAGFWIAGLLIYKPSGPRKRDKTWSRFLTGVLPIFVIIGFFSPKHLLSIYEFPLLPDYITNTIGIVLLLTGLIFAVWARVSLGRFWSGHVAVIANQPIIRKGPYARVRHPIYTGYLLMLWGSFLLEKIGIVLFTAIFGTILLLCKAKFEEALLARYKEQEYLAYKKEVPRMIM